MFPHTAPPQLAIVTFARLFSVSQSPASARVATARQSVAKRRLQRPCPSVSLSLQEVSENCHRTRVECFRFSALQRPALIILHRGQSFVEQID
jgi:hypothetical protein